ncbi:AraC family ligand binding domain-containing protein, partial [Streptomyces sparsus]
MATTEWARHWRHDRLPGLDLLRARYVRHAFPRHSHEGYTLGAITGGVEEVGLPRSTERVGSGGLVMINPEVAHTARAGAPEGWTYFTLYPSLATVTEVAAETTGVRGTPAFAATVTHDPVASRQIRAVHRAAEDVDALAADSLLRVAVARLLRA